VSKINTDIGIGSARVVFNHKDEDLETSIENFTVNESGEINVGDFDIIEEEINVGDGINLTIGPVTSSEGDPIPDLPLKIVIKIPGGSELILEGNTNENGELEFDSSKDLEDQGIKIIQGNIEDISKIEGEFTGYVEVEHDGEVVRTNFDSYVVESENTIPEVVRTGAFNGGIIILIALSVFILAYILKDRYGKPLESDD
jgi:hypothetical protein